MKVVIVCGTAANQKALANRLHAIVPLSAIALINIPPPKHRRRFIPRLASMVIGWPLRRSWRALFAHYDRQYASFPDVPTSRHFGVNSQSVRTLLVRERADFVLVSGTDLLCSQLIEAIHDAGGSVLNLHTGLSPYIKGGPNCTNWALALQDFGLIGNTIMWLDSGIDTGAIVTTERTPLTGRESLLELHRKVMDHGHDCYCRSLDRLRTGIALPSVPQSQIDPGRLFLNRQWTISRTAAAVYNFYRYYSPETVNSRQRPRLVSFDER